VRLCFVVPAHGRVPLARIILARLAQVCAELDAQAVVVANDDNLLVAHSHGMHTLARSNDYLGRKFNDGIEYAARIADNVMPLGSDDLIAPGLVAEMLARADGHQVVCTDRMAVVPPDGSELVELRIPYQGGAGPRLIPAGLLERCGGRPADDMKQRAIDTSIKRGLGNVPYLCFESHPVDLVDLKTAAANLNTFEMLLPYATHRHIDVWDRLAERHPAATVESLKGLYKRSV
jgi:hypothetical protein